MRWIWLDRIVELDKGARCVAIKAVTAAEDVLHDHFEATDQHPAIPVMPNSLIIEGMAQTAGILVGHANDFAEKVILAKIQKAEFSRAAHPGCVLRHTATLERLDLSGGMTTGVTERLDPQTGEPFELAKIDLMFSHIDQNRAGLAFPEHNFVFSSQLRDLLTQSGVSINSPS